MPMLNVKLIRTMVQNTGTACSNLLKSRSLTTDIIKIPTMMSEGPYANAGIAVIKGARESTYYSCNHRGGERHTCNLKNLWIHDNDIRHSRECGYSCNNFRLKICVVKLKFKKCAQKFRGELAICRISQMYRALHPGRNLNISREINSK